MSGNSSLKSHATPGPAGDAPAQERPSGQASAADLAEFEKFFREQFAPSAPAGGQGAQKAAIDDPLMAELARIVGQDVRPSQPAAPRLPQAHDPFAAPVTAETAAQNDPLKAFEEELRRFDAEREAARLAAATPVVEPELRGAVSGAAQTEDLGLQPRQVDFEQDMRPAGEISVRPELPGDSLAVGPEQLEDLSEEARPRSRKVMMILSLAGIVALVGVVGTLGFGGRSKPTGGDAPVIVAKPGPTKEKPADPGGVEISGQDRQVLARRNDEPRTPAAVVNKEEQPVDLNQTPKRDAARVILPPTNGQPAGAAPAGPILMPSGANASGQSAAPSQAAVAAPTAPGVEPKRVRSVRVSGEGEVTAPPAAATAPAAAQRPQAQPSLVAAPPPTAQTAAPPKNDARPATAARTVAAAPAATTPQPARPAAPRPAPAAAESQKEERPMSLSPPPGTRAAAPARTSGGAGASGSGGFAVQLKSSPTESDARAAATELRQRLASSLGGHTPGVRQGTVDGKTVYRVRVSGLSREEATGLCNRIKSNGGSCFVAGN